MRIFLLTLLFLTEVSGVSAQIAVFGSVSSGYQSNPLCNYQSLPDNIRQSYAELSCSVLDDDLSSVNLRYIGGLVLFSRLSDRTYYEHSFRTEYSHRILANQDEESGDSLGVDPADSSGAFFQASLTGSARHDRSAFREFDNAGLSASAAYRIPVSGNFFARATVTGGSRSYLYLSSLTNFTAVSTVQIGSQSPAGFQFGFILGAGLMTYPHAVYDTSLFEETPTYIISVTKTNSGSGKGGTTYDTTIDASEKVLLAKPRSQNSYQLQAGIYCALQWNDGSVRFDGCYRNNYSTGIHALVLNLNTSSLNEDIYCDYFSYEGPELTFSLRQSLPFGIQSAISAETDFRSYAVPGMDLDGSITASTRSDMRFTAEVFLSREIVLFGYSGAEISLGASYMRNRSNDAYNDCSLWGWMAGLGINL